LPDLVLLMDESHRYRASAELKAINELHPILVLELTATPFAKSSSSNKSIKDPVFFKNIIYDYPLSKAMEDGYVKEPAVVTQKNFDPSQFICTFGDIHKTMRRIFFRREGGVAGAGARVGNMGRDFHLLICIARDAGNPRIALHFPFRFTNERFSCNIFSRIAPIRACWKNEE
jgi:hypothetical protein